MGKAQRRRAMRKYNKKLDALFPWHREFREDAQGFLSGKISGEEAMSRFAPLIAMLSSGEYPAGHTEKGKSTNER